jgi:hypothetical protein
MADLNTLDGIAAARNELYNELRTGTVTEARAAGMERLLRGQESLKGQLPIRLLNVMTKMKGSSAEHYLEPLVKALLHFTTGEVKALGE